jgi:hypothetical protein
MEGNFQHVQFKKSPLDAFLHLPGSFFSEGRQKAFAVFLLDEERKIKENKKVTKTSLSSTPLNSTPGSK